MKNIGIIRLGIAMIALLAVLGACSSQEEILTPSSPSDLVYSGNKNGTETLGVPSIPISGGSGFAEGGVGMVGVETAMLDIDVPVGATVNQTLVYWAGGTTGADGDNEILVDGVAVEGVLIGGPINFFSVNGVQYYFSAYRADITGMNLVVAGPNSFEISEFDFDNTGGTLDENNGVSIVVIYDDGTDADIDLVDGLDMAFFDFVPTLDATVPQVMNFGAEASDRTAELLIIAGSVGEGRPNQIKVTSSNGDEFFTDILGSSSGLLWDSLLLTVLVPANDSSLTVQLISTDIDDPLGASLGWLASGLAIENTPPELACLGDFVWNDVNMNGIQDAGETGIGGVYVDLMDCNGLVLDTTMTDESGFYMFCELDAGDYKVQFVLPDGYVFSPQNQGADDAVDSDADTATGMTTCTNLEPGENDLTWDAGMYMPVVEDCGECDGKITELSMRYLGDTEVYVEVYMTKGNARHSRLIFEGNVGPNEEFSFVGNDKKGTMGPNISLYVDGELNVDNMHTSCSQPVYIGMIKGDFEVTDGQSRNGGQLCTMERHDD